MRAAAILLCAAALTAAVAGAPEPSPAGVLPAGSASSLNDIFGNGLGNGDDFRTAGVGGHARLGRLVLAADAAMLTDRARRTRSDELVLTAGWVLGPLAPRLGWQAGAWAGGGLRVDGDLAGERVQNGLHRRIGSAEVHLPYDGDGRPRPLAAGSATAGWLGEAGFGLTGWWGVQAVSAWQWTPGRELIATAGPRLALVGHEGSFWLGASYRLHDGEAGSAAAAATAAHEEGWWIESGTTVAPGGRWGWQVRTGLNPETRAALGSIGLVVEPGGSPGGRRELAVEHDLAIYGGGGFGVQVRWQPDAWSDTRVPAVVLDYRFGTEPDGRLRLEQGFDAAPDTADLRHDQWTLGWEESYLTPDWSGWRFAPFAQAAAGVRQEGVMPDGNGARSARGRAVAPVLRGAFGARALWAEAVGAGFSLDGWLPAWDERLRVGDGTIVLNDPGWAWGLHLVAHIAW